ncbi:Hypothetical protein PBC10988_30160 [Planctomycetales bacterium 10988]|nr:Hypothetical protein PBC10988_30160 [Planctomycetales bacterium 10988]
MSRLFSILWVCTFYYSCLPATSAIAQEPAEGQKYALLIGVDDYTHLNPLKFCGSDMRGLRDQLLRSGFAEDHIYTMHDRAEENRYRPNTFAFKQQLKVVLSLVEAEDTLFIAFSGHGLHLEGKSYLCPLDANPNYLESLISVESIFEQLAECPARQKLFLVDACRNEVDPPGRRSVSLSHNSRSLTQSLQHPPSGLVVLTSCDVGEYALEDENLDHGIFTHFLMEGLQGKADFNQDGLVKIFELFEFVNQQTKDYVARNFTEVQRPTLKGELNGNFIVATLEKTSPDPSPSRPSKPAEMRPSPSSTERPSIDPARETGRKELVELVNTLKQVESYLAQNEIERALIVCEKFRSQNIGEVRLLGQISAKLAEVQIPNDYYALGPDHAVQLLRAVGDRYYIQFYDRKTPQRGWIQQADLDPKRVVAKAIPKRSKALNATPFELLNIPSLAVIREPPYSRKPPREAYEQRKRAMLAIREIVPVVERYLKEENFEYALGTIEKFNGQQEVTAKLHLQATTQREVELKIGTKVVATLRPSQEVEITKISDDWLWVEALNPSADTDFNRTSQTLQGWAPRSEFYRLRVTTKYAN